MLYNKFMAKVQFNCRLDESFVEWIDAEAARQSEALNRKFSQADVIMMLVGSAIHSDSVAAKAPQPRKQSKKAAAIEALRASDPMAGERSEIEYGSSELPSGGSVSVVGAAIPIARQRPSGKSDAYQDRYRGPLLKPGDAKR